MLQHCIKRNFGGFEHSGGKDPLAVFSQNLKTVEKISKVITMCSFSNETDQIIKKVYLAKKPNVFIKVTSSTE